MIRYGLRCEEGHGFDCWFRSSADYDAQAARGLLVCPVCGSRSVAKALMAPALGSGAREAPPRPAEAAGPSEVALLSEQDGRVREMLRELKKHVAATSEDVGDRFPALARQMHEGEIERRAIRGRATLDEAKALAEEGVPIQPLPAFPEDGN